MPSVEPWYVLSSLVRRYISFNVNGTWMNHLFLYHQWYGGISLSCLQWNVGMCYRQWYGGISLSSSVVRRLINSFYIISGTVVYLFHAFSGTLVCVIVSGTAVYLFHRQWYVDELSLFISSVVRWYISSCLQWNVGMCYRQWYGGISLSSSLVRR